MKRLLPLLLLTLLSAPLRADEDVEGAAVEEAPTQAQILAKMKQAISSDPRVADSLADRVARSTIAAKITDEEEPSRRLTAIRAWIAADPESAAQVAAGLAQDDAEKSSRFQDLINRTVKSHLSFNKDSRRGIYGRLNKSSKDSKLMGKQGEMSEEEKREILKTMFEGQGGQTGQVITQKDDGKSSDGASGGGVSAAGLSGQSYFDRLGQGNLRGYSPQLMAMQSDLNARRPPGAPKLIESGKLDYATLSYPGHGMRFDIGNLEARLRYQQAYALAQALGLEKSYTQAQLADPAILAQLKAKAAGKALSPRFERRAQALEKAARALKDFDGAALAAQDPAQISKALLGALGARQKEAARWITVASLEEELQRLESEEGFLSAELLALIDQCPFPAATLTAYKKRGEEYKSQLARMKANAIRAVALLESDAWVSSIEEVDKSMSLNSGLRKDLFRNIRDLVNTPYRLGAVSGIQPRWRVFLEDLLMRYVPSHAYAKQLKARQTQKALLSDVFSKIASGDLDAAHTILASYEPSQAPPSKR